MAPKVGVLTVEAGRDPGRKFIVKHGERFTVGRDRKSNTYGVPTATNISRNHCKIENRHGVLSITDLDSKNGTYVNGKKVDSRALRDGDEIHAGGVRFKLEIVDKEPKEETKGPKPDSAIFDLGKFKKAETSPGHARKEEKPAISPPKPAPPPEEEPEPLPEEVTKLVGEVVGPYKIMSAAAFSRRTIVYKAHEPSKNRLLALKLLNRDLAADPAGVAWFTEGAKRGGPLRHENVVPIVGGGRLGDTYYVSEMFMARGSAEARFRRAVEEGIPLVKVALQAAIQVVRALEFGVDTNILHLGVRPSKVLFDERRRVKLNGLGFNNGPGPGFDMESDRALYLAPEQKNKSGVRVDFKADIYGLGGSFYYMLTGRPPVRDARGGLRSPRDVNSAVPESLCRIIERMLDLDPASRYDSYGHLLHDLRWALRGEVWPSGH